MAPRDGVFTIKAQLKGITKPPVWRRIRIVGGASFGQLHEALQAAFEWEGHHLHVFQPKRVRFSRPVFQIGPTQDDMISFFCGEHIDEESIRLDSVLPHYPKTLEYVYDFGDDWVHTLTVESWEDDELYFDYEIVERRGAAPGEDCGGIYSFMYKRDLIVQAKKDGVDLRTVNFEYPETHLDYAVASLGTNFDPKDPYYRPEWESLDEK